MHSASEKSTIYRSRSALRRSRGAAAVEFAVCAPVLFLLVFGIIDVGRAVMVQNLLTNAARDGARAASLGGATVESVQSEVSALVPGATASVSPDPLDTADLGDPVSVTVAVPYDSVSWLPSKYLSGVTLESTIVMRREVYSGSITEEEEVY